MRARLLAGIGTHDAAGPGDGDNADPGALHLPENGQGVDGIPHLDARADTKEAGPLEDSVIDVVLPHEGSRVGQRRLGPHKAVPRLQNDDGLFPAHPARRFQELGAPLQALHVDDDHPRLGVVPEVVEGVRDVDIAGVAHIDGLPDVAPGEVA